MNEVNQALSSLEVSVDKPETPGIQVDSFQARTDCFFVWVGLGPTPPTMPQLVMAAVNPFDKSSGAISSVLAHYDGDTQIAQSMCRRLSKRVNKIFYMTATVPKGDNDDLVTFIERQIIERIKE